MQVLSQIPGLAVALDTVQSTYPIPKQRTYTKIRKFYVHIKFEVVTILSDNDVSEPSHLRGTSTEELLVRLAMLQWARQHRSSVVCAQGYVYFMRFPFKIQQT